jgi:F420-dependent oxidoreductase-like protein
VLVKLGLQLGYWGAQPPSNDAELVAAAESAGYDAVFTAEAWGSDAYTPLAWWGRHTTTMRLGTSVVQLSARTPTACAMAALTLDHLSGGRHILGLGVSGPQVVEGWYGQRFPKPLARTREYVDIVRQVWARQAPVTSSGPHYPLPLTGEGSTGLGKPLKPITHPLRADIPIMLGAEGPKNVALAAEIADGWLPIFYSPRLAPMYNEWLDEGFARPGARRSRADFEICATAQVVVTDDRPGTLAVMKPYLALYLGGMGSEDTNFHANLYRRMGYGQAVDDITKLFRSGRKDEAAAIIPDELVDDAAIVGDIDYVRGQLTTWEQSGVTMVVVGPRTVEQVTDLAAAVRHADVAGTPVRAGNQVPQQDSLINGPEGLS